MDDARVAPEHAAVDMHDGARRRSAGLQPLDHLRIASARHEADVLAVGLLGDGEAEARRGLARLRLGHLAEGKTQHVELAPGGGEHEVALVALVVTGAEQAAATRDGPARDIVPGGEDVGAEVPGRREKVAKLDALVAVDAGDRRLAGEIGLGETVDHGGLEPALIVEHVVGNSQAVGDGPRVVDVATGTTRSLAVGRLAVIVELQRHPDHLIALVGQERRDDGGIDAAGHGDDDARCRGRAGKTERIEHRRGLRPPQGQGRQGAARV